MTKKTEDMVRDIARDTLGLSKREHAQYGVGQLTTFNQLGFPGVADKPDGWYLPDNHADVALILETKASTVSLGAKQVDELLKNIKIANTQYNKVIGILYNGDDVRVFMNDTEMETVKQLQRLEYYLALFKADTIDKEHIYELTAKINNYLHFEFGIKNLYHRMIFTACALVAKRYDALMVRGMGYSEFHNAILNCLNKELIRDKQQNRKLSILTDVFARIEMNLDVDSEDAKQQQHVKELIAEFIEWVTDISDCLNSDAWRGEDVMGIFFNEFNRYKKKSEAGQVFTPEHITDFMYRILQVDKDDHVLDGCCGSGGFLIKSMANMIQEAGGVQTDKAKQIKCEQLYGIEFDKEIYALACANMLIHKDGKTNLEQMDARTEEASKWIAKKGITKILMNPPYENKYGCMTIIENMMDSVPAHTMCGFILPDKKLEKASKTQTRRILKNHRLKKIIKLPEDLFFGVGVTTSIFVFETGIPQGDNEIFGCYMETDGLQTVKNKGRHDVRGRWGDIEKYWVDSVLKLRDDKYDTAQWIKPSEHLSYQMPEKPFEVFEEDFRKTAMDYLMFQRGIDTKEFGDKLLNAVMYSSRISDSDDLVSIALVKGGDTDGED
ncbi:SAM-dependent methyltransferase [Acetanaerobacterium sp. MSJ-12]|uniref:HsdM family class I SAM-dependent methyltransferase n=1 Tax=Acetanaerobacterium sp. MSJ-12 TaxID=2841535 RepID=UPI001C0EC355|nr:N-6 DNA methylase [Acetanaerobacterium sp. MSJ-12]MBU5419839.1 SAM-dependent methyltransferase [Acetanaerobacterium sp. MSJ-12]